jgi:N-glycosylase/DNA lyase
MQTGNSSKITELKGLYLKLKYDIDTRLDEFKTKGRSSSRDIFAEMCFCILTPQSRAVSADKAIRKLVESGKLFTGNPAEIRKYLIGVRFQNNKADYIAETRRRFTSSSGRLTVRGLIKEPDVVKLRNKLVREVKGYGLKEASHFLRNIGYGSEIAILDRHILKELVAFKVIQSIPPSLTQSRYHDIERRMRAFSRRCQIPLDALDLVFWYSETGYIFK